ncbi:hypothetical protein LEP1GSC024_3886 [Leptospira noguchii str. 2001034031]|uniref:Uncharacterized protein n=1 Tax=Leptospira noguchii str. 2001034031 TaxID=1193053 RepID=M6YP42_9LEPT|nr:hypothetical protein LEP1GSC024_3886 [Leptospira noguchii str. 2001034031]
MCLGAIKKFLILFRVVFGWDFIFTLLRILFNFDVLKKTFGIQKQFLAFILSLGQNHVNYIEKYKKFCYRISFAIKI